MADGFEKYGFPDGKRYNSFVGYFKRKYGERLQKIVLDAGFTCPNRDGKVGRGGCTYCDNAAFHPSYSTAGKSLHQQMDEGIGFHKVRYRTTEHYLAYFQSFSNTYAPLDELRRLYEPVLEMDKVIGLVVGTRPDCVDDKMLDYFSRLGEQCYVMLEYGVESTLDRTLERINRGHTYAESEWAIRETAKRGIHTGAHIILGLPGESDEDCLSHADRLNELPLDMLKLHQLQIVKGTTLARQWLEDPSIVKLYTMDEYIDLCVRFLQRLKPEIGIERFISQSPKDMLLAPDWGVKNYEFVDKLRARLRAMKK